MASVNGDGDRSPEDDREEQRLRALKFTCLKCGEGSRAVCILDEVTQTSIAAHCPACGFTWSGARQ